MNFNDTEQSQTFPVEWSLLLPEVYEQIADNHHRGNFLSMIYRKEVDNRIASRFQYFWENSTADSIYQLTKFPLRLSAKLPPMEVLADHLNFLRSDHTRFWYMNDTSLPFTLNAVLFTDTGPYRGNMRNCYHAVCDSPEVYNYRCKNKNNFINNISNRFTKDNLLIQATLYSNPRSLKFLAKITQVLAETVADMSQCEFVNAPEYSNV